MIRTRLAAVLAALVVLVAPALAHATWSVVALDRATGRLVVASATCVSQSGLRARGGLKGIQAIVAPKFGVAAAQASVDGTRQNQSLVFAELKKGTHPSAILQMLMADSSIQGRQFGIIDMQGRLAGWSGARNGRASLSIQGQVAGTEIYYSIQGNILASYAVVQNAVRAFEATQGELTDRVMAAMEAADAAGGDRRCTCASQPLPQTNRACTSKTAHVAYILAADSTDADGESFNDGIYSLFLDVHELNTRPEEDANPVKTLRMRYDAWRRAGRE
jgi:uncharacterized Ntn-hydrolase superfamily protein